MRAPCDKISGICLLKFLRETVVISRETSSLQGDLNMQTSHLPVAFWNTYRAFSVSKLFLHNLTLLHRKSVLFHVLPIFPYGSTVYCFTSVVCMFYLFKVRQEKMRGREHGWSLATVVKEMRMLGRQVAEKLEEFGLKEVRLRKCVAHTWWGGNVAKVWNQNQNLEKR